MLKPNQLIIIVTALTLLFLAVGFGSAQGAPISKDALISALKELRRGDSRTGIIGKIRERGVSFELTEEIKKELTEAGSTRALIEAVRANYRKPTPGPSPEPTPHPTPRPQSSPQQITSRAGIELMLIPAGSFIMGSENGLASEKPVHRVTITEGFYMGRYEVTQAQWHGLMGNHPSHFKGCDNCPVENVSWDDVQSFINRLNESNDRFRYRLPTEAEWEYACRAGTTGDYAGNLSEMGWSSENAGSKTHAVGGKQPNAWGLADMHGNVWEWCQDWYHETYHGAPTDGSAWLSGGEQEYRVLRGGSWYFDATYLRSAFRSGNTTVNRYATLGIRLVAVVRTQ